MGVSEIYRRYNPIQPSPMQSGSSQFTSNRARQPISGAVSPSVHPRINTKDVNIGNKPRPQSNIQSTSSNPDHRTVTPSPKTDPRRNTDSALRSEPHRNPPHTPSAESHQSRSHDTFRTNTQHRQTNFPKSEFKGSGRKSITDFISNLIPKSVYNSETKKILGFLEAEDLLIIALIFLFLEDKSGDNQLLILALLYVLLSDYINLEDFLF